MKATIVRGNPYSDMEYSDSAPYISAQKSLGSDIIIDNDSGNTLLCGEGDNNMCYFIQIMIMIVEFMKYCDDHLIMIDIVLLDVVESDSETDNKWSKTSKLVTKELRIHLSSDFTWLVFVSEPTEFVCSNKIEVKVIMLK